jgi:endo-1,4-beta-xylanase
VLPSKWTWDSSPALVDFRSDAKHKNVYSVKDPTIVQVNGVYHCYATISSPSGWSMVYFNFTQWSEANSAPWYYMDQTAGFSGYKCAPQLFYFTPQKLWYLVFQSSLPTYSTNADPSNPRGWSNPKHYFEQMPSGGLDFFTICDDDNCYLFFSNDGGLWYRTSTPKSKFPSGWSGKFDTVLKSSDHYKYFEGSWVYRLTTQKQYMAGIEGIGSDGQRYYQTFVADSLGGSFKELSPDFATNKNVKYPSPKWNNGISHGELVRVHGETGDETMLLDPCHVQFWYQGTDPSKQTPYEQTPYKLGLLNSTTVIQGC